MSCCSDFPVFRPLVLLPLLVLCLTCSERPRRNPLDPRAEQQVATPETPLRALAANGRVVVSWDYGYYRDIDGFWLYRRQANGGFGRHPGHRLGPQTTSYTDSAVTNGQGYEYRLGLVIHGEGERLLPATVGATPGPEVVWAADRLSGLIWQVAPDGRNTAAVQGRFRSLEGMDVAADGACWATDRQVPGIYRLALDGSMRLFAMPVEEPGDLRLDVASQRGWLIDKGRGEVHWFDTTLPAASLRGAVVDAHFAAPVGLAPQDGGCWIGDAEAQRVLYAHPDGERVEYTELSGIRGLASDTAGCVWVLADAGHRVVRLSRTQRGAFVDLPFAATDVVAASRPGRAWVVGHGSMALITTSGAVVRQWSAPPGDGSLALDSRHGTLWVAAGDELWKLTIEGRQLSLLRGFSALLRVAVCPDGGSRGGVRVGDGAPGGGRVP